MTALVAVVCAGLAVLCWPRRDRGRALPMAATTSTPQARGARWSGRLWRRRDRDGDVDRMIGMLEGIGPAIGAGVTPVVAVGTSARLAAGSVTSPGLRADLHVLAASAASGMPMPQHWSALAADHRMPALDVVARAWALSDDLGCGLAESLATATSLMRESIDRERRVAVVTAGARATMQLLTLLPVAGVGVAALMGLSPWRLYAGHLGVVVVVVGGLLILSGRALVRRMTRRACAPAALTAPRPAAAVSP